MTKNRRILSIIILTAVALSVICAAGVTLALDISDNRSTGSISTAGLDLTARAGNIRVYSAVRTDSPDGFTDAADNRYEYVESTVKGENTVYFNGRDGGVTFDDKSVAIDNMLPGDKVEFDITIESNSTIAFNYRAELYVDKTSGINLLNQLDFKAGALNNVDVGTTRLDVENDVTVGDGLVQAVRTDYTEWDKLSAGNRRESVRMSVVLPIDADKGNGESVKLYYVVRAEQSVTTQTDVAKITDVDGNEVTFKKLADAVRHAQANKIDTIEVIGSTAGEAVEGKVLLGEEGLITVSRALKFAGVKDEKGNSPVLNGARFAVTEGAVASFDGIVFSGDSYIDVTSASGLTLKNCIADVNPSRHFDDSTREFTDKAFVTSSLSLTPVKLALTDNVIVTGDAAVGLRSLVADGSVISGNTFGLASRPSENAAALTFNGGSKKEASEKDKAVITVANNEIYSQTAIELGNAVGEIPYMVISSNNVAVGLADGVFVSGKAGAKGKVYGAFTDSGSKVDGTALTVANVKYDQLIFGGVNVTIDATFNLIASGDVYLSRAIKVEEFKNTFAYNSDGVGISIHSDIEN